MMDPMTKEEVKGSITQFIATQFAVSLEELTAIYQGSAGQLSPAVKVPTLLAEMVMESRIEQRLFRVMGQPVRIYYFPLGTINAHLLQTEMADRARHRPQNFDQLSVEEQWNWDKALGILDWRNERPK
jgi:hypothetical protein